LVSSQYYSANGANGNSANCDISVDGRYVVYESTAKDIVPSANGGFKQVYLFDRTTGTTTLLSYSTTDAAPGNYISEAPIFTGDGQTVIFQSFASDLMANDFNVGGDLFALQLSATNAMPGSTNSPLIQVCQLISAPGTSGSSGTTPALAWPAASGTSYQVLYKDNLTDPVWQPLNGCITILGTQGQAVDFSPNPVHRFYKIVAN
jgi:hypothetical protein